MGVYKNMKIEDIENNKQAFLNLVNQINRDGVDNLIQFLLTSDFFTAPASTKMYRAEEGGLCAHALARYNIMKKLVEANEWYVDDTSLLILGLLADLNKVDYFEVTSINKKVYSEAGKKMDEMGHFDWVAEKGYKVKDPEKRFIFGTSGQNAERIVTNYIPLKDEESAAIINLGVSFENPTFNYANVYKKYGLACVLAAADSLATFCTEGVSTVELPF